MKLSTAPQWLEYIQKIHPQFMDLTLARINRVAANLKLLEQPWKLIVVGGTNGKGSCVTTLATIYLTAGYRVGTFMSPALLRHNDQIKINGYTLPDESFCQAFATIEAARGKISLTYFEFFTLAALWLFQQQPLDVVILEVGLGGRLDAVNILQPDISIVTSVDLDHCDRLGPTREHIGFEKAGIFRKQRAAICGDPNPPHRLIHQAQIIGAKLYYQGQHFSYREDKDHWHFSFANTHYHQLPRNQLLTQNLATALAAICLLDLPVTEDHIQYALTNVILPGRLEVIKNACLEIHDVAHNPAAIQRLANYLRQSRFANKTFGVFSMLADKAIKQCVTEIADEIDHWYVSTLKTNRSASETILREALSNIPLENKRFYMSIFDALKAARMDASEKDRIVVFGSFYTVAAAKVLA